MAKKKKRRQRIDTMIDAHVWMRRTDRASQAKPSIERPNPEHRDAHGHYREYFKKAAVKRLAKETPREVATSLNISLSSLTAWRHYYGYNRKAAKAVMQAARARERALYPETKRRPDTAAEALLREALKHPEKLNIS